MHKRAKEEQTRPTSPSAGSSTAAANLPTKSSNTNEDSKTITININNSTIDASLFDYVQHFGRTRASITKEREQSRADLERHYDSLLARVNACQSAFVSEAARHTLGASLASIAHLIRQHRDSLRKLRDSFDAEAARIQASHAHDVDFVHRTKRIRSAYAELNARFRQLERRAFEELVGHSAVTFRPAAATPEKPSSLDYEQLTGQLSHPVVAPLLLDSLIVSSAHTQRSLLSLCNFATRNLAYSLVYRASRDGFSAADFHVRCDHLTDTLLVVKSTSGCIFGGFAHATWSHQPTTKQQQQQQQQQVDGAESSTTATSAETEPSAVGSCFKYDPLAFLFSLVNKEKSVPVLMKCQDAARAIVAESRCCASFGTGRDLHICSDSHECARSFANIGHAYRFGLHVHGSEQAREFLAGADYFLTSEIECFHVRLLTVNDA